MPREIVQSPDHDRDRSLGDLAVLWMHKFCVHGPGDVQGQAVDLDEELREFTADCYALDKNGRRLYDSVFLSRPKGRDKSGHAARMVLFEAFGPCRFAGFAKGGEEYRDHDFVYVYEPGEPMGRPVTAPFIRCLATEESQAGNTYDNVYFNLVEGPLAERLARDQAGLTRTYLPGGGEIRPSTASNAAKDGGRETFCVFDETHLYILPELRRMYGTVRRNMGNKRKDSHPWSLETSTMYLPGEESVAEETHRLAKLIDEGKTAVGKRARLFFDHREASPDINLENEEEVREGLRDVYGAFYVHMDERRILDEIADTRNDPQESRRYRLNQPTSALDAWILHPQWAAIVDAEKVVSPSDPIVVGFDGSRQRSRGVTDATAIVACRVSDGHFFDPLEKSVWEQPSGPAGDNWRVPAIEVNAAIDALFTRYPNVVGFFADPAKWESYIAQWEAKYARRLKVKATQNHPIEWWMTGGRSGLIVRALEEFRTAVVEQELTHDGSYALTLHVLNARRSKSRSGFQIAKEHPDSPNKIDAAVAAVLAWQARLAAIAAGIGQQQQVPRRVR